MINPRNTFIIISIIVLFMGCAYYNTFFNAEENYRQGIEKKNNNTNDKLPPDIQRHFNSAIAKSWKVIDVYGDSSRWADDALLLIGMSYYQLEDYDKAIDVLEQFLQKYLKSKIRPNAELWLAKTYLKNAEEDKALERLSAIVVDADDNEIKGEAYYNIGEIYYNAGQYEIAIENFLNCINETSNSETAGEAQYKLADSYFQMNDYEQAVTNYEEVLRYDITILKQYDAVIQMVNSLLELSRFERAEEVLLNILRDQRFKTQYSMIATKLANMIEFRGDKAFAVEKYREVMKNYPRSEGSALASFYIAQIYEFEFGLLDSAKVKYDQVKKEFSKSESAEEATERSKILAEYLKIKDALKKDKSDMYKLIHGDSLLVDSLVTGQDTLYVTEDILDRDPFLFAPVDSILDSANTVNQADTVRTEQRIKDKKVAVSRDPKVVEASLVKNSFRLAEFFLLNYQHYDSALAAYNVFTSNFYDSLLTPKAYYSLYFIYNNIRNDSLKADSIKNIVIERFPETDYGQKLQGKTVLVAEKEDKKAIISMFQKAESFLDVADYENAITLYNQVAKQDSGSIWAKKSRYAIAYIYENMLLESNNAINNYTILAQEYPDSEQGRIAKSKIAEPPLEKSPIDTITQNDSTQINPMLPDTSFNEKTIPDSLKQSDK